jgi:hypothetical protein
MKARKQQRRTEKASVLATNLSIGGAGWMASLQGWIASSLRVQKALSSNKKIAEFWLV